MIADSPRARRDADVSRVLVQVLLLNFGVAVLKLSFGHLAGSVSMVADGYHSLLDASSNVLGLLGSRVARKAPDDDHPYGHRKFEALAALGISLFLVITCYEILSSVIGRFRAEHDLDVRPITMAVMVLAMIVSYLVSRYERREGDRLKSMVLMADSRHTQSDVYTSLGVLVSLIAAWFNIYFLDLFTAVAIAGVIAYLAYTIIGSALPVLSDAQVVDPDEVIRIATGVDGVTDAHRIRSRGLPDDVHIDLHLHVSPDMSIRVAHDLAHEASSRIRDGIAGVTDVVIHVEPDDEHTD